jgi:hypothetical protein
VEFIGESKFIMVARRCNQAAPIYGLLLPDEAAKKRFQLGHDRSVVRKVRAANSLAFKPPLPDEINLIHQLYLTSKLKLAQVEEGTVPVGRASGDQRHVMTKHTKFSNTQYMHLQVTLGVDFCIDCIVINANFITTRTAISTARSLVGTSCARPSRSGGWRHLVSWDRTMPTLCLSTTFCL